MADASEVLLRAHSSRDFVVVHRSIEGSDDLRGYVVGIGERWVLLNVASDDVFLNGYTALRLDDVVMVEGPEYGHFSPLGLAALGEYPVVPDDVPLDGDAELSQALAARFGLLTIHLEFDDPEVCHIGHLVEASSKSLWLLEVTPAGEWEGEPTPYPLGEITRLEAGGRYERALALVAGPPPESARASSTDVPKGHS